jgi:DNA invertase Pin-like site-specific DNA recombinase
MDLQDGSFETQRAYYLHYIKAQPDMIFAGVYGDHGKSGRSIKDRPEFQRMLQDCEAGRIDLILTKSISRFARNLPECISTIRRLQALDVAVIFEKEGIHTGDQKSELLLNILATVAQEESNSISQNMRWSRRKRYEIGQPWEVPSYGYVSVGPEHRWIIEESQAGRVQLAFYLAGTGHPYPQIRASLNELEAIEDTGRVWNQTPVHHLLTNLSYIGDFLSNKECTIADKNGVRRCRNRGYTDQFYIEEHHMPLVSRELFAGVGELIRRHLLFANRSRYSVEEEALLASCRKLAQEERKKMQYWNSLDKSEESRCG